MAKNPELDSFAAEQKNQLNFGQLTNKWASLRSEQGPSVDEKFYPQFMDCDERVAAMIKARPFQSRPNIWVAGLLIRSGNELRLGVADLTAPLTLVEGQLQVGEVVSNPDDQVRQIQPYYRQSVHHSFTNILETARPVYPGDYGHVECIGNRILEILGLNQQAYIRHDS